MSSEPTPKTSDDLFCPHFHEKNESDLRSLFSRVAAVRAENPELFWFTHRPIELFQTEGGVDGPSLESGDERVVTEDDVYQEFSASRNKNFAVVIEGEVGTGKSELCVALTHKLENEANRPVLRVDKNTDLMSMLTEEIPDFYQTHFGETLDTSSRFKRLEDDIKERPRMVASHAVSTALLEIGWDGYETTIEPAQEDEILDFVAERIRERLVETRQYGEEPNLVTKQEYDQNSFLQVFEEDADAFEGHPAEKLSSGFWQALLDQYDTPPLTDLLEEVGEKFNEEYDDKRPVAVFEDFSITGMQARQLRNFMERDNPGDNWDFIVAGTRDSTAVLHKRTAEDRFRFYRTNKQNSNQVLFLDDGSAVDFIRPYLGYIKHHDGSVRYDRGNDTGEFTLLDPESDSLCATCGLCDDSFRDLFPFNQRFVERIYTGLDESEQSPRELIIVVFETVLEYFNGTARCPATASPLEHVTNRVVAHDDVYHEAEVFADVAKWYGDTDRYEEYIAVDRAFFEAFDLLPEHQEEDDLPANIELTDDHVKIPGVGYKPPEDYESDPSEETDGYDEDESEEASEDDGEDDDDDGVSRVERIINEQSGYVDNWYANPHDESYVETDAYLRTAFTDLINTLTQDYSLWTDCDLRYNLSRSDDPFVYASAESAPNPDQIILDPRDFQRSDIRELLQYGIRREEADASADQQRILDIVGGHLTAYARQWRTKVRQRYIEDPSVYYKYDPPYGFDDFILAAYAWIVVLDDPWQEVTATTLNKRFASGEEYALDATLKTALTDELAPEAEDHIEAFMGYADAFDALVAERLAVSDSTLNLPRLRRWLNHHEPQDVLSRLRADPDQLNSRVRFDTDTKLVDMVTKAFRMQKSLDQQEDQLHDYTVAQTTLNELAGTDMEWIHDKVEVLDNYDVDRSLYESLLQFDSYSQDEVDAVVAASQLCLDTLGASTQDLIHKMLIEYKLMEHEVTEAFNAIDFETGDTTSSFAPHFQEVSQYYVEGE
ncbi:hypothetical protein [Halosimplex salinum]|uniref:hypothetical protein n=1 Tax=Halosimplex salinum TaxID=1710538 RepID=UPI000F484F44|nr:hypothetical protein [Halosimplex salinum]